MVYCYHCENCSHDFEVIKSARYYDDDENCPKCQYVATREFVPRKTHLYGTRVEEAEYNPGLGCVVRGKAQRNEVAKQKGLEEIGNEKPETIHKYFDKEREQRRERAWEEADKGWVGAE